jgi:gliding motility-associated-like protein
MRYSFYIRIYTTIFLAVFLGMATYGINGNEGKKSNTSAIPQPVFDNVTILPNGNIELSWSIDIQEMVDGFLIEHWVYLDAMGDAGFQELVTIDNGQARSYTIEQHQACSERAIFTIKSIVGAEESLPSRELQTVFLNNSIDYQICESTATLYWTSFFRNEIGEENDVDYAIWVQVEDGTPQIVETISAENLTVFDTEKTYGPNSSSSSTTSIYEYAYRGLESGLTYNFYIEALHADDRTSRSCSVEIYTEVYQTPEFFNLLAATVTEQNQVDLLYEADISAEMVDVEVFRSANDNLNLSSIGRFAAPLAIISTLTDETALPDETAYYYQMAYYDSCGLQARDATIHRTMHLTGSASGDNQNELQWNTYEGWEVDHYLVYRKLANENDYEEIAELNSSALNYTDNLSLFADQIATASYFVEAVSAEIQIDNLPAVSQSNRLQVSRESDPIMPNAFKPNGITPTFKPVVAFFGSQRAYLFQIYNRWGQLLFETTDAHEGWDGKYKGNLVPGGVYVYLLNYEDAEGDNKRLRGTVTVVY